MRRHMSRSVVRPENWPELSEATQDFIDCDVYAGKLYEMMRDHAWRAVNWYDVARKDRDVARWIPQGGGGDCFLVYPGDEAAHECEGMYDALSLYAGTVGRDDVRDELDDLRHAFFCPATEDE